ncbi:hypothetical protein [uncultured Thiohalocapsa sp.]|uniref:hypothetical protein n=1 Tax=uncultured Thiohalocapsa sp. TaxID=768990 RepID=UPI0025F41974|nr:hypothetical protein [uncultured Thiohalocapsa sp.]
MRGARLLPGSVKPVVSRDIDRYEMLGVIDVVSEIELFRRPDLRGNPLLELIVEELPGTPPAEFEVIIDYKGMKRPDLDDGHTGFSHIYDWQIHTYAHLRGLLTTKPIIAGVLVYLNELAPTRSDFFDLRRALRQGTPGVLVPEPNTDDADLLLNWKASKPGEEPPLLSFPFRLRRAIKVVPVDDASMQSALKQFDDTVGRIETCITQEAQSGRIISSWEKNPSHDPTCEACDSNTYCPDHHGTTVPRVPGIKP